MPKHKDWILDRDSGEYVLSPKLTPNGCAIWLTPAGETYAGNKLYTVTVRGPLGYAQLKRRKRSDYRGAWTVSAAKRKAYALRHPFILERWGIWEPKPEPDEYNIEALLNGWA